MTARNALAATCLIALAAPALAESGKQIKGVLERVDVPAHHILIRETHGGKHELPLDVATDTKIATPSGDASLEALHVGDSVIVSHGPGPSGEMAREIQVTKSAATD